MAETIKPIRLSKAAKEFNVGITTIVEFLSKKGTEISASPNTKLTPDMYELLEQEFQSQKSVKEEAKKIGLDYSDHQTISIEDKLVEKTDEDQEDEFEEVFIKDISLKKTDEDKKTEKPPAEKEKAEKPASTEAKAKKEEEIPEAKKEKETKDKTEQKPAEKEKAEEPAATKTTADKEEKPAEEKTEKPVEKIETEKAKDKETIPEEKETDEEGRIKVLGKIDLTSINEKTRPARKSAEEKRKERELKKKEKEEAKKKKTAPEKEKQKEVEEKPAAKTETKKPTEEEIKKEEKKEVEKTAASVYKTEVKKLEGPKILDKIDLPEEKKRPEKRPVASSKDQDISSKKKKKRRRIQKGQQKPGEASKQPDSAKDRKGKGKRGRRDRERPEISEQDIQQQIKETLAKLTGGGKSKAVKHRREKRQTASQQREEELKKQEEEKNVIKVTEFVTANELANMMNVPVNQIIATCMSLGLFVSINQRLDAETLSLVAEEFGYKVEFVSVDVAEAIHETDEEEVEEENLEPRSPIVTVMGHVDHGKTKLLDHIRKANVVAGEAGGITQHIGAYEVVLDGDGSKAITFLDTPGHEAFTAMRARGAKVTDVAIIVVAADDNVMPQTKEAINHAQAAGVPIVFAINKIDKPNANPEKIKEELSNMNILVEDWGGKFQSQEISAKQGINVDELLEKVLLEAELLDLKANPNKPAYGTIIESSLDKGRGYVAKILVQDGSLKTGDMVIAGSTFGKVKAMYNERNQRVDIAGPSTPVLLLGLNGAPQAGDGFNVMKDEREAKAIANKRLQLQREQGIRTQKHITLDEIGRRIAIGDFKELNIIVKGDVDGSVEALSDSLLKLSNEQIQVNIIHKSVGQVTETDVMLASASDAVIVAFQVRPSVSARKLAEQEQIDIRLYSIIYQAIEEIKAAMEGMLSPDIEEKIVCNVEVREVFKITKVGTVAGCYVLDGTITRKTKVRIIRDGIVVYTGTLGSLKRFKDDVKEVKSGYECGLNIENYNDIKVGDIIEGYEEVEVKKTLS